MKAPPVQHMALAGTMIVVSLSIVDSADSYFALACAVAATAALPYHGRISLFLIVLWSFAAYSAQLSYYLNAYRYESFALLVFRLLLFLLRLMPFALLWIHGKSRPQKVYWPRLEAWYLMLLTLVGYSIVSSRSVVEAWLAAEPFTLLSAWLARPVIVSWPALACAMVSFNVLILPALYTSWRRLSASGTRPETTGHTSVGACTLWTLAWGLLILLFPLAPWYSSNFGRIYELGFALGMALIVSYCLSGFAAEARRGQPLRTAGSLFVLVIAELLLALVVMIPLQSNTYDVFVCSPGDKHFLVSCEPATYLTGLPGAPSPLPEVPPP